MIRFFTTFFNSQSNNDSNPDERLIQKAIAAYKHHDKKCPNCGASGKLSPYGVYGRGFTTLDEGETADYRVNPPRYKCSSCKATHALLPDVIIPYSPYSLRFMVGVLISYIRREAPVEKICLRFGIAVSTLYEWKKRLLSQMPLLLGCLFAKGASALAFLDTLFGPSHYLSTTLESFFLSHGYSFMQNIRTTPRSSPP